MAEFGSLYGGYLAKNQMNRQEEGQNLQQMGALQGLLMKAQAMQEQEKIKGVLAQSGGDPKVAMQALISAGTPQSLELASKLHSLIPDPSQAALRQAQAQKAQVETAEGLGRIQGQRGLADLLNPANASLYTQGATPNKMFPNEEQAKQALIEAERTGTPFSGVVPNQGSLQSLLMQAQPKETASAMARSMFAPPQRGVVVGPGAAYIPPGQTAPAHVQPFAPRAEPPVRAPVAVVTGDGRGIEFVRPQDAIGRTPANMDAETLRRIANAREEGKGAAKAAQATQADQRSAMLALKSAGYDPSTGKDRISELIKESTSGALERGAAAVPGFVGISTSGMKALRTVESTANSIVLELMNRKLGAGISNADRDFIVSQLGDVGNAMKPAGERLAAWTAAKNRMIEVGLHPPVNASGGGSAAGKAKFLGFEKP